MGIFFGTDGIRGVVNDYLTYDVAFKCGNALGTTISKPTVIIGGDTRPTRSCLTSAFAGGIMTTGGNVIDIGICPTAGIAYITKKVNATYGTVVSASHNPAKYNGIKIFNKDGVKLGDKQEEALERKFIHTSNNPYNEIGNYSQDFSLTKLYEDYLVDCCNCSLNGLTILLDGSNGASHKIAPAVFRRLGAKVIATHCQNKGEHINENCGSLYPEVLSKAVKKYKADMGFAFDGDSDRIIACDENGNILDGDIIIYILSKYLKDNNRLAKNTVVGTKHTNMGIEKTLREYGINLIRTDIGDKYVIAKMEEDGLSLGGEKSGHIIFRDLATTGDGILTGIKLAELVKNSNKKLSELNDAKLFPQINIDCIVDDKIRIMNSEELQLTIREQEKVMGDDTRIMVRMSGTESKIRIMCEGPEENICLSSAKEIEKTVKQLDTLYKK